MSDRASINFIVNAPVGGEMESDMPLAEASRLLELADVLVPGTYEGLIATTTTEGDSMVEVFYSITHTGRVDIEVI